ncbi:MAG: TolC family protein [Arcobacteraceae bacterium]
MKAKLLLSLLATSAFVFATTVEELVQTTFEKNYTLHGLEKAINSANENIVLAKKWQNPMLSFGANDIQFDDVSKRDLEAMQAQFIGITQVIPMGNKLEYKEEIALKDKAILHFVLEDKKLELQSKIYELAASVAILEKKLELLEKYLNNINRLEQLNIALYENNQALQTQVLNSQMMYSKVNIQKIKLNTAIKNLYIRLEELTQEKIEQLSVNLEVSRKPLVINYEKHPKLQVQELLAKKALTQAKLEAENKIPDISFNIAYFQRDSKFEDYVNFSVAIPLAIYGTENSKVLVAKSKNYEELSRLEELEKQFNTQTKLLKNDFDNALASINVLETNILPLQQKVQESIELYNSLEKIKPQEAINSLNEQINFELSLYDEQLIYFQTLAKAMYYNKGVIQ